MRNLGKRAVADAHGGTMSGAGFYTAYAIAMLNTLVGNLNVEGGLVLDAGPFPPYGAGPRYNIAGFANKATPIKAALLDQRLIAGLGNIYVCEALWRSELSPLRKAGSIATQKGRNTRHSDALAFAVRSVIADAIEAGGSSLKDYVQADGALGYFQHSFSVYDREGKTCKRPGCGGTIQRIVQSGRSTFFCPACQK